MTSDRSFQCPNCGSPLTTTGADSEIKCPYCGSTVIVPKELRQAPQPQFQPASYDFGSSNQAGSQSMQSFETGSSSGQGGGFSVGRLALPIIITVVSIALAGGIALFAIFSANSAVQQAGQSFNNVGASFATLTPAPTPTPTEALPTPVPFTKVLFKDDFANASSGWPRARNSKYTLEYKAGNYHILINEQGQGQEVTTSGEKSYTDASVEVDLQQTAGPNDGLMGVTCRNDNNGNFYSFEFSQDGTYGIYKYVNDSGDSLDEQTLPPNVIEAKGLNHIEARCEGDTLTLIINGQVLSQVQDSTYTKGQAGLLVRTGSSGDPGEDVLFSHLVVKGP